jgi:alkylresorcinol/alkylpyrone synthase
MFVVGLGTAAPLQRFTQLECWEALQSSLIFPQLMPRSRAILKKVLRGQNGIATRHLALTPLTQGFETTPDALHARFTEHAPALATSAAVRALANAACRPEEMDAVIISTCTGYLCPGLTSYVSQRLGLRPDVLNLDLVGQGCGAAVPNLRAAEAILAAGRGKKVLSVCVEVCSAAVYLDDDPGVLISACLFGDGAGAAVLSSEPRPGLRRVEWKTAASCLLPEHRDMLRFTQSHGMLRNILLPQVPEIAGAEVAKLFDRTLAAAGVARDSIVGWVMHTGGRDVLQSLRDHLKLTESDVRHSTAVLSEFGNISSPTVYFVLERALQDNVPDGLWWMSAFGAGFSCHGALLEISSA